MQAGDVGRGVVTPSVFAEQQLGELKAAGVLSELEFEQQKDRILNG